MYVHRYINDTVLHAYKTNPVPSNVKKVYDRGEVEAWFVDLPASVSALVIRYHGDDHDFERLRFPSDSLRQEALDERIAEWTGHVAALSPRSVANA